MTKRATKSRGSKGSSRSSEILRKIKAVIRSGRSFLVTTHFNPDGDALGSAVALALGLRRLGKKVTLYNTDPVPCSLRFLPLASQVVRELPADRRYDAAFIVDCADLDRVGKDFSKQRGIGQKIVIDHHAKSGRAGDLNLIDRKAAASGIVVFRLLKSLGVPITREIATAIYCALITDTGNFRYSNTDASVLKLAHDLVSRGVDPWTVSRQIFENFPVERLKLLGMVLATLEVSEGGRIASIVLTRKMLEETGAAPDLAEEFINFPRSIDTVEVAVQFRELEDGCKVSFRSKSRVDVASLAAAFGGGGHARAAGCTLKESLTEVKGKILDRVRAAL